MAFEIEKSLGFLLSKAYQRLWAICREELEVHDITPPQFALLAFLWEQDGQTQAELSEKSQIDRTTIGGLIDRLEKVGLIRRQPHPQDRRAYRIVLTGNGRQLEPVLNDAVIRARQQFTTGLSASEISELTRMLEILRGERNIYEKPPCFK